VKTATIHITGTGHYYISCLSNDRNDPYSILLHAISSLCFLRSTACPYSRQIVLRNALTKLEMICENSYLRSSSYVHVAILGVNLFKQRRALAGL